MFDAEYLSSYVYRLVFEEDYAIAINSEVKSQAFATHEDRDMWESLRVNRYQDFQSASIVGDEVRILHLPEVDVDAADRRLGGGMSPSPVWWGFSGSAGALSRYDYPSFRTTAEVPRVDIYPRLSMPAALRWLDLSPGRGLPRNLVREEPVSRRTWSRFRWCATRELARTDVETGFDLRPPALERDFSVAVAGASAGRRRAAHHRAGCGVPVRDRDQ